MTATTDPTTGSGSPGARSEACRRRWRGSRISPPTASNSPSARRPKSNAYGRTLRSSAIPPVPSTRSDFSLRARRPRAQTTLSWRGGTNVPHGAIVRFKLCYRIEGRRLIDDDAGAHYLAPAPSPDRPPPPPPELIEAAAAWR